MDNFLYRKNKGWNSVKNLIDYQKNTPELIYNNKPSYTTDKAAEQLSRHNDALLWQQKHKNDEPLTITYAFPDWTKYPPESYQNSIYGGYAPQGLTVYQQQQAKLCLQAWQDVANIKLVEVDSPEKAMITFGYYHGFSSQHAHTAIRFSTQPDYYVNSIDSTISNQIWFNIDSLSSLKHPALGNDVRKTYIHELGHALGLDHPGNYSSTNGGYEYNAPYKQDSHQFSVMSYWDETTTGANHKYDETNGYYTYHMTYHTAAPLLHDIAAIQKIHGANTTTRTGDSVYGFNSNTDRDFYSLTDSNQKAVFCVWDAGGNDTLDFSKYSQKQRINLNEDSFSDVGGFKGNVSIAQHTIIENAIGGSGNDVIVGNDTNNTIEGGKGDDIIYGGKGQDTLWGGNRNDVVPNTKTIDLPAIDVEESVLYDGDDDEQSVEDYADNEVSNPGCTTEVEETVLYDGDDDEQPVEDYADNEVSNPGFTTEVEETVLYDGDDDEQPVEYYADNEVSNPGFTTEVEETVLYDGDDDEQPVEDYADNEVSNPGCTTSPWTGYNGNSYCPWINPACNNNGYSTSYYSAPMYNGFNNGFTYSFYWPGQYYSNNMAYKAYCPNQQSYCNNNNYGYYNLQPQLLWGQENTSQIIDSYSGNNINSYYHDKKAQEIDNGSGKDTFVFASIEDSPFDNPDIIMDFETGIDKIDLSAIILINSDHYRIAPIWVDHLPQKIGEMQLTYDKKFNLSHFELNADNDDTPDFALDIYGVVQESDFMLA